jgi:DNA repair protein SbcC/Rad50
VTGLEAWVCGAIGLTNKTFASSVLLRQGEADKFVTATPAERKGVLMDVLDLKPYVRLEEAARRHAKEWKDKTAESERQLQGLTHASTENLAEATRERDAAREAAEAAVGAVRTAERILRNSQTFANVTHRIEAADERLEQLDKVLATAPEIEAAQKESAELNDALPMLRAIHQHRQGAAAARSREREYRRLATAVDLVAAEAAQEQHAEMTRQAKQEYEDRRTALAGLRSEEDRLRPLAEAAATATRLSKEESVTETEAAKLELETAGLGLLASCQVV